MDNKLKCIPFIIENDNITECGYANGYVAVPKKLILYMRGSTFMMLKIL